MTYTKQTWTDEVLADVALYDIKESDNTPINSGVKIDLATDVVTAGSGVTAERMGHMEDGIYNAHVDTAALTTKVNDANDLKTTGGTSTAYTITTTGAAALVAGEVFRIKFHATAGTTPTLNRDSKGAKLLKYYDPTGTKQNCTSTQIIADVVLTVLYDGTDYVLIGGGGGTTWGSVTGTLSNQTDLNDALNNRLAKDADGQVSIGLSSSIADNTAISFTPPTTYGMILVQSRSAPSTNYLLAFYVSSSGGSFSPTYSIGSNTAITTGTLTGTTGTAGKLTVSVNTTDGKIYIENRTGASRNVVIKIW